MDTATRAKLYDFIRQSGQAVIATVGGDDMPEAALIDIAVTPELDLIFETTSATRKFANLEVNPKAAFVIGWGGSETLQYDGQVGRPDGEILQESRRVYLSAFPEKTSHQYWPGNYYFRARPIWIRFSDYYQPRKIEEYLFGGNDPPVRKAGWRTLWLGERRQHN